MKSIQSICLLICRAACSPEQDFPDPDTLPYSLEQEAWPGLQFGQDAIIADLTYDGLYRAVNSSLSMTPIRFIIIDPIYA